MGPYNSFVIVTFNLFICKWNEHVHYVLGSACRTGLSWVELSNILDAVEIEVAPCVDFKAQAAGEFGET